MTDRGDPVFLSGTLRERDSQFSHSSTGVGGSSSFTFFSSPFFDQSGFFCKIEKALRQLHRNLIALVRIRLAHWLAVSGWTFAKQCREGRRVLLRDENFRKRGRGGHSIGQDCTPKNPRERSRQKSPRCSWIVAVVVVVVVGARSIANFFAPSWSAGLPIARASHCHVEKKKKNPAKRCRKRRLASSDWYFKRLQSLREDC